MNDNLIERLSDEADQCRNDGADDIAKLVDEARAAIERHSAVLAAAPQPQPVPPEGPMAETVEQAARDVAKCLNERDGQGLDLRHVAMLVHYAQQPVQEPVAWALQFGDDVRICLSTVFDTRDEAQDYASSCIDKTELTPLYTSPQAAQPLSDEHLSKLLCALHSETNAKINLHEWLRASPALAVRIAQAEDEWVKAVKHLVQVQMAAQEYATTHGITKGTT